MQINPDRVVCGQEMRTESSNTAVVDLTILHAALAKTNREKGPWKLRDGALLFHRSTPYEDAPGVIGIVLDRDSVQLPTAREIQYAFKEAAGVETRAYSDYFTITTVDTVPLVTDEAEPFVSGMGEITL
jgi:hypothetical protein